MEYTGTYFDIDFDLHDASCISQMKFLSKLQKKTDFEKNSKYLKK